MKHIDELRRRDIYTHDCSENCTAKGCGIIRIVDGCWTLAMEHCMFATPTLVKGYSLLQFPNVCTAQPLPGSVFCQDHHTLLEKHLIPTKKEDFLRHLGCRAYPKTPGDIRAVDSAVTALANELNKSQTGFQGAGVSALNYQGTQQYAEKFKETAWDGEQICNKETGEKSRLRQRARGHIVAVTGGGHILYFDPLFKSEGPSQAFIFIIRLMVLELQKFPADILDEEINKYVLCYDNICNLSALTAARHDLPLPPPFSTMFFRIKKCLDRLHIRNHVNPQCRDTFNPDKILPPGINTMAGEQTFAWLSRFKKIINSMNQCHHLFFLHRTIQRRNRYTEECRKRGVEPLLPNINQRLCNK